MSTLIGNPTSFGESLYIDNLLQNIKHFVVIGSDTLENQPLSDKLGGLDLTYADIEDSVLHTEPIVHAAFDNANNQAYFDCIIPYTLDLQKYVFAIGLVTLVDGVNKLVDWTVIHKQFQTAQIGGTFKYMVAVTSESGGVIFKDTDYVTQTELDEKFEECCSANNAELPTGATHVVSKPTLIATPTVVLVGGSATITATAIALLDENVHIASFIVTDGENTETLSATDNAVTFEKVIDDEKNFEIQAVDNMGNVSEKSLVSIGITQNTPPNIDNLVVAGWQENGYIGGNFNISVSGANDDSAIKYKLTSSNLTFSKSVDIVENEEITVTIPSGTVAGDYTISVSAIDAEGLESTPVVKNISVVPPTGQTEEMTTTQTVVVPKDAQLLTIRGHGTRGIAYDPGVNYKHFKCEDSDGQTSYRTGDIASFPNSSTTESIGDGYLGCASWSYVDTFTVGAVEAEAGTDASIMAMGGDVSHTFRGASIGVTTTPATTTEVLQLPISTEDYVFEITPNGGMIQVEWE